MGTEAATNDHVHCFVSLKPKGIRFSAEIHDFFVFLHKSIMEIVSDSFKFAVVSPIDQSTNDFSLVDAAQVEQLENMSSSHWA